LIFIVDCAAAAVLSPPSPTPIITSASATPMFDAFADAADTAAVAIARRRRRRVLHC